MEANHAEIADLPTKITVMHRLKADPGFPVSVISTMVNFTLANMLVYGLSGNLRAGMFAGLLTVPVCLIANAIDTERDYEHWKVWMKYKEKGFPDFLAGRKPKYNWSYYEPLRMEIDQYFDDIRAANAKIDDHDDTKRKSE